MTSNIVASTVLLVLAIAIALVVYFLLQRNLRGLLDDLVKLPSCTTFYIRLLAIGLVFIALSAALDRHFNLKGNDPFMEYVWAIAEGLPNTFIGICLFLTGYLFITTILVAVLRRKNE